MRIRTFLPAYVVCAALLPWIGGCANFDILSPTLLQDLGLSSEVSSTPGEAPAILLEVENQTQSVVEMRVTWRDGNGERQERTRTLGAGAKYAEAVVCPVEEVTLGDVGNLDAVGAIVRLGGGGANDAFIEVEPFGVLLQEDVNYSCGDSVNFAIVNSNATRSGFQIIAFIRRAAL